MSDTGFTGDEVTARRQTGQVRKKRGVDRSVLELAYDRLYETFKLFDHIAVSFSGGKDSTAVLNLTLTVARDLKRLPLRVFFYDEEAIPFETEHYVRRVAASPDIALEWYCLPVQHRNACSRLSPYWWPYAPEAKDLWVRPLPPEGITSIEGFPDEPKLRPTMPDSVGLLFDPLKYGRVGMLMGIRADESITRTRAILARQTDTRPYMRPLNGSGVQKNYSPLRQRGGVAPSIWQALRRATVTKVYPIYDWTTEDVWTAPAKFGWDYNRSYNLMELAGMPHSDQRCAPPYGEEPMCGLYVFAQSFPDIWDRMCHRVPGAATAARYARSELYAFGGVPKKPAGMTWPAFVQQEVRRHPQPYRGQIAAAVKYWVDLHTSKTGDPIAPTAAHPVTGVSWSFLVMLAVRGDYKGRKQPTTAGIASREKYAAEINQTNRAEIRI